MQDRQCCHSCDFLYRPPVYNEFGPSFNDFIDDFSTLLEELIVFQGNLLIVGDFNVHVDCSGGDSDKLIGLLDRYGLKQHVARGQTLDLIIT